LPWTFATTLSAPSSLDTLSCLAQLQLRTPPSAAAACQRFDPRVPISALISASAASLLLRSAASSDSRRAKRDITW
jgi:hypothetical protein